MSHREDQGLRGWLEALRAEYWRRTDETEAGGADGPPYLLFEVAGRRFAVDAGSCRGVVRHPGAVRLPGVPPYVLGVAGVRGEVVSVVDLQEFLGIPGDRPPGPGYLVLMADEAMRASFWVDRIVDVVPVDPGAVRPVEGGLGGAAERVLAGELDTRPATLVLDARALVRETAVPGELEDRN